MVEPIKTIDDFQENKKMIQIFVSVIIKIKAIENFIFYTDWYYPKKLKTKVAVPKCIFTIKHVKTCIYNYSEMNIQQKRTFTIVRK